MRHLCEAMGICLHEYEWIVDDSWPKLGYWACKHCTHRTQFMDRWRPNPSPTDEAFCWRVLTWLIADRKRFRDFLHFAFNAADGNDEMSMFSDGTTDDDSTFYDEDFMIWLFSNPARFIGLADEWCRENGGGK